MNYIKNEKELGLFMKNQIPDLKGDVKFKLYKTINIYGDFIPVFEFNYDKIYAGYMKGVKINRLKMSNCILISTKVKNHKLVDEIIYHEIGHYVFAKYSGIDFDKRIPTDEEELFCDYYSYLACGESFLELQEFIGGERIRFLKKLIKRNIDIVDLFHTVAIRYRTICNIFIDYLSQDVKCIEKYGHSRDHIQFMIKNKCERLLINQDN